MPTIPRRFWRGTAALTRPVERRRGQNDRRHEPRGGRRVSDRARLGVMAALFALVSTAAVAQGPVQFGFDAKAISRARGLGMPVTYGSTWAGAWNQKWGWNGIEDDLRLAKAAGAVPVIQWWYWGDDISPSCVENGCQDRYHGVRKDRATWSRLSNELADLIVRVSGAQSPALVVIETEFNKNGIENHEPFDGYLAEQAAIFHQRGLKVVVSFGNWGQSHWKNFDRAVASADLLGTMALQSSLRDAPTYLSGADQLITAARYFQTTFAKPTFVTDFAFSSFPEPSYELHQDTVVRDIFRRMGELRAAGVQGMIWRMLSDDPAFDTNNYHGIAERHWGLLHADGSAKAAFLPFLNGMLAEHLTRVFTDASLSAGTSVKAIHLTELRARIDTLRADWRLPQMSWTDAVMTAGVTVKAEHLSEPRSALTAVYHAAGLTSPSFTNPAVQPGRMMIQAVHILELRAAVVGLEGVQMSRLTY